MEDDISAESADANIVRAKLREREQDIRISDMKINELTRRMLVKPQPITEEIAQDKNKNNKSVTQYPNSLGSARKKFNSTGIYYLYY